MSIASLYPSINPSLLLDFANVKRLDPRITFTRTTTATYYDGVTTAVAEQNLLTYSQEFDNAAWSKFSMTVTANAAAAPDGTTTAELLYPTSTGASRNIYQSAMTSGVQYTISVYAKASGLNFLCIYDESASGVGRVWFNLSTGAVGTVSAGYTASISNAGGGWYRCVVVRTVSGAFVQVGGTDADNSTTSTTSGTNGILLWGAQLEQRSSATAYTATTTQAITNYIPVLQTAAAGQARFDHNPTTGESLGLLIEEARTNRAAYSQDFSTGWTTIDSTLTTNTNIAPDGTLTADTLTPNTTNTSHYTYQNVNTTGIANSSVVTQSAFVKANGYGYVGMEAYDGSNNPKIIYDLANLSYSVVASSGSPTGTITDVGNGWRRISMSWTVRSSGALSPFQMYLFSFNANSFASFAGNGFSGAFIWGAQFEVGSFATSYIPNLSTGSTTRNADAASMTGTNFSSWFGGGNISIYAEAAFKGYVSNQGAIVSQVSDGSTNNNIDVYWYNGAPTYYVTSAGSNVINLGASAISANTFMKFSAANAFNDSAVSFNGAAIQTDTSCALPTGLNKLNIGNTQNYGVQYMSGWIKKLAYYPQRLTNTNLVALAS